MAATTFVRVLGLLGLASTATAYATLSDDSLRIIPSPGNDFDINDGKILAPILIPRVPGTPGSTAVLAHFADFFRNSLPNWTVELQNSTSKTPTSGGKEIPFVNLIATRDPPWVSPGEVGRLALVAHYDSKIDPPGFIGAIDSAAPCAMIMHTARSIDEALTKKWAAMEAEGVGPGGFDGVEEHTGIQMILLDGEEAFQYWTHTDSTYGARALASEWEQTMYPATSTYRSPIDSIDMFVLLDLLGSASPRIPSFYKTTHWAYQRMAAAEQRLRALGMFKSSPNHASKRTPDHQVRDEPLFLREAAKQDNERWLGGMIEDDHLPFQARGVDILHIIPAPFPSVWHEMTDDGEHLDMDTVHDWATLVTAFAAEWMELEGFMTDASTANPVPVEHQKQKRTTKPEHDRTEL